MADDRLAECRGGAACRTQQAAEDAIRRFNGEFIGSRKVRCDWAQHKQDMTANDYTRVDQADPQNSNGAPLLALL